jgi:molybdenum cofactor cytidylyltransferase
VSVAGLVLAAGAGSRFGQPKVLFVGDDGVPWVQRAAESLQEAGCKPIVVTVGAGHADAEALLASVPDITVGFVERWADGISASIVAGLAAIETGSPDTDAVVIVPVDVPSLTARMVLRVLGAVDLGNFRSVLAHAGFRGTPGHPVLIGRDHWAPLRASLSGDIGARPYLIAHGAPQIDCTDLGTGADVDTR